MKIADNTIKAVITFFYNELNSYYEKNEIDSMLYIVLEKYFEICKKDVILGVDKRFSESELLLIIYAVKDLKKYKPLAYILGEWEFYSLQFKVNEYTLIPRPETEELVQLIITENSNQEINILDIGTGSGCIAIALAKNIAKCKVSAFDVSREALLVAQQNAMNNKVEIAFEELDILNPPINYSQKFNVIVSNPPYIPNKDKAEMDENVLNYEPHLALFVENDNPLAFYFAIADFAVKNLTNKGKLYFEIHEKLDVEVSNLLVDKGFTCIQIIKDLNGKDRMISATFNN